MINNTHNIYNGYEPRTRAVVTGQYDNGVGITSNAFGDFFDAFSQRMDNKGKEKSFQIGAAEYTSTEWEKLLSEFDDVQDTVRRLMRERHDKQYEKHLKEEEIQQEQLEEEILEKERLDDIGVAFL